MTWVEKNPVSAVLLGACGLLVLIGIVLTLAWSGPVESGRDPATAAGEAVPELALELEPLGALRDYEVVNSRPLFNETRRPMALEVDALDEEAQPMVQQEIAGRPKVRLTGVVITPEHRVVTLTPEAGGESLVVRNGMPLEGENVGWSVDQVRPRRVRLVSTEGEQIELELAVHDAMIEKPPEPAASQAREAVEDGEAVDENRSRADEIRERIRERREQLRAEAEQQAENQEDQRESARNRYQEAIRAMMQRNNAPGGDEDGEQDSGDE